MFYFTIYTYFMHSHNVQISNTIFPFEILLGRNQELVVVVVSNLNLGSWTSWTLGSRTSWTLGSWTSWTLGSWTSWTLGSWTCFDELLMDSSWKIHQLGFMNCWLMNSSWTIHQLGFMNCWFMNSSWTIHQLGFMNCWLMNSSWTIHQLLFMNCWWTTLMNIWRTLMDSSWTFMNSSWTFMNSSSVHELILNRVVPKRLRNQNKYNHYSPIIHRHHWFYLNIRKYTRTRGYKTLLKPQTQTCWLVDTERMLRSLSLESESKMIKSFITSAPVLITAFRGNSANVRECAYWCEHFAISCKQGVSLMETWSEYSVWSCEHTRRLLAELPNTIRSYSRWLCFAFFKVKTVNTFNQNRPSFVVDLSVYHTKKLEIFTVCWIILNKVSKYHT